MVKTTNQVILYGKNTTRPCIFSTSLCYFTPWRGMWCWDATGCLGFGHTDGGLARYVVLGCYWVPGVWSFRSVRWWSWYVRLLGICHDYGNLHGNLNFMNPMFWRHSFKLIFVGGRDEKRNPVSQSRALLGPWLHLCQSLRLKCHMKSVMETPDFC